MAGDWLKIESATPDKPEVWAIADALGIDPDAAFGKLFRVWAWFDTQTRNGNAPIVTQSLLDRIVGVTGFCSAMQSVGWLRVNGTTISVPNFDRHNGKTAKDRAVTQKRVQRHRKRSGNDDVTPKSLPEKRRDISPISPSRWGPTPDGVDPQAWEEWAAYKPGKPADGTITKTANFLRALSPDAQRRVVDDSIRNAWKGLFQPKGQPAVQGQKLRLLSDAG